MDLPRLGNGGADQSDDARRYLYRAGMETVVALDQETPEQGRLFFHPDEKKRTNPAPGGKGVARRRADRIFQPGAPVKRTGGGARTNHQISSRVR